MEDIEFYATCSSGNHCSRRLVTVIKREEKAWPRLTHLPALEAKLVFGKSCLKIAQLFFSFFFTAVDLSVVEHLELFQLWGDVKVVQMSSATLPPPASVSQNTSLHKKRKISKSECLCCPEAMLYDSVCICYSMCDGWELEQSTAEHDTCNHWYQVSRHWSCDPCCK